MIAIGIGCRKGASGDDVVALVRETLAMLPPDARPDSMFSIAEKEGEPGLHAAAKALSLPLTFLDRATLTRVSDRAHSRSSRVDAMFALPSVAETAALAGAGDGAVLLVGRRASSTVTCAVAGPADMQAVVPSP